MAKLVVCPHDPPGEAPCEFRIQSENETEVVEFVQQHAHDTHALDLTEDQVHDMMQNV